MNPFNALTLFILLSLLASTLYVSIQWIYKEQRRRAGQIWALATFLTLIAVLIFASPTVLSASSQANVPPQAKPTPAVATIPPNLPAADFAQIELNKSYPSSVVKDVSFTVSIEVVALPASTPTSTPTPAATPSAQPTPVGTPGTTLQQTFGPDYNFYATAQLSGSAFEIDPTQRSQQTFNQSSVIFTWTVIPKSPERQRLQATVTGMWVPKSGGASTEYLLGRTTLTIFVQDPSFIVGQISPNEIILFLVGSVLNVPWIWDLVALSQARRKLRQKTARSVSPSVSSSLPQKKTRKK